MKNEPALGFSFGYQLVGSIHMTDWYELIKVKRTFWERFLTKPWMPQISYAYKLGAQEPKREVYMMDGKIIGHPATLKIIADQLAARAQEAK